MRTKDDAIEVAAGFSIAIATEADAIAIAAVRNAAADDLTRRYGRGHWSGGSTERGVLYGMRSSRVLVARDDDRIVATLRLATKKPWAIDTAYFAVVRRPLYLLDMAVEPSSQRRGLGSALVEEAKRVAREWPADAIRLDAYDSPAGAGPFYETCAFREVGRVRYREVPLIYYEWMAAIEAAPGRSTKLTMRVTFHGAARTVTGSKHLVELDNGARLLLDCGMFQGRRAEAEAKNRTLPFEARSIDAVLLSHAHIDHSGLLPRLYRDGFRGRIWATHATYDLCALMLLDSASIQERDLAFVNKTRARRGEQPAEPLYSQADAEGALELFTSIGYRQSFSPARDVTVEYRDAGHILGSATMVLEVQQGGGTKKLGFTGDIGNPGRPIVRDASQMADCDWLISESTYGGIVHDPPDRTLDRLAEVIGGTAARGGKVIIPAFAVGRTQEVVFALDQLGSRGRLPNVPIFVDSPLAVDATGVYLAHPECYDEELSRYLKSDVNPWSSRRITYVREVEASKRLNESRYPMVVLSASGMAEAGRVLHHLRHTVEDPRHTVLIVGYCADHTLGKKLVDREPVVRIFGEEYRRRCQVEVMNSLSAHADEPGLLAFLGRLDRERLERVFLVHGAPERQAPLAAALAREGYRGITIPEPGESVVLT